MTQQRAPTNPVILLLLAGILLALVALVAVLATNRDRGGNGTANPGSDPPQPSIESGTKVTRDGHPHPPESPSQPVADPNRIRETLREGRTYQMVVKMGMDARTEDKDWGIRAVTNLAYVGEMAISRKIERNDGTRIVELRHFEACRNVKVLHEVEGVSIELGLPGYLVLVGLELYAPGTGSGAIVAKPAAEAILGAGAQHVIDSQTTKAFAHVDSLSGKKVRITYVDGVGVESIEPVDCTLSPDEVDFALATAILSDCYLFPDINVPPGGTWKVDAGQLIGFLDPSLRSVPKGSVVVVRDPDQSDGGRTLAGLRIDSGLVTLDSSDHKQHRVGTFSPRGTLLYSLQDGYVVGGELTGDITIDEVSKDHLLFESRFQSRPRMKIDYSCRMLD